jgi:hypothetical protein
LLFFFHLLLPSIFVEQFGPASTFPFPKLITRPQLQLARTLFTSYSIVGILQMRTDAAEINEAINRPQQMILGDMILQRELVEERRLRLLPRSHHPKSSRSLGQLNQ